MPNKKLIVLQCCVAAAAMMAFGGCKTSESSHADHRSEGRMVDDKHLKENIQEALKRDPTYKFDTVGVAAYAGTVQLSGFVESDEQKARAEEIAKQVGGVTEVVNGLTTRPQPATPTGPGTPRVYSE